MAYVSYEIHIEGLDEQVGKFARFADIAAARLKPAMADSVLLVRGATVRSWPVGVSGRSRSAWSTRVVTMKPNVTGYVTNPVRRPYPYPLVVEFGRRKGKAPPPGALDRWVQIVMGVPANLAAGVAFVVGRKMKKRPIKGKRILEKAFKANRARIIQIFKDALDKIAEDLSIGS
jgi:hypothetical protein